MFAEIAERRRDDYMKFHEQFGEYLKCGTIEAFTLQLETSYAVCWH